MTKISEMEFDCPKCGHHGTATAYHSVNVTFDPKLKEKLLDGSLFKVDCENCGQELRMPEQTLYHDMDAQLMVFLYPLEEQPTWQKAVDHVTDVFDEIEKSDVDSDVPKEDYTRRVCFGRNELIEKIRINEAGLDDGIIEIAKLLVITSNREEFDNMAPVMLFSQVQDDGKWEFVCFDRQSGEPIGSLTLDKRQIEDAVSKGTDALDAIRRPPYVSFWKMIEEE